MGIRPMLLRRALSCILYQGSFRVNKLTRELTAPLSCIHGPCNDAFAVNFNAAR